MMTINQEDMDIFNLKVKNLPTNVLMKSLLYKMEDPNSLFLIKKSMFANSWRKEKDLITKTIYISKISLNYPKKISKKNLKTTSLRMGELSNLWLLDSKKKLVILILSFNLLTKTEPKKLWQLIKIPIFSNVEPNFTSAGSKINNLDKKNTLN